MPVATPAAVATAFEVIVAALTKGLDAAGAVVSLVALVTLSALEVVVLPAASEIIEALAEASAAAIGKALTRREVRGTGELPAG